MYMKMSEYARNESPRYFTRVAQKVMSHVFSRSKYLFKKRENNIYSSEKVRLQTLFFHKVSVHFYNFASTRNKCV
jgi:hypothetical protein